MERAEKEIVIVLHLDMQNGNPMHFEIGAEGFEKCKKKGGVEQGDEYGERIWGILEEMGFSRDRKGAVYLQEGIRFMVCTDKVEISMSKDVYPYLADKYHTSVNNVERNIRVAIERVWTHQEVAKLQELYGERWSSKAGRPANSKFMKNISRKVTT